MSGNHIPKGWLFLPTIKDDISCSTELYGINNFGSLAGIAWTGANYQGFLDYVIGGRYAPPTNVQGADAMLSINNVYKQPGGDWNLSQAVGYGQDPSSSIIAIQNQAPANFRCVGANATSISAVNDDSQMAGSLNYDGSTWVGFVSPDTTGQNCHTFVPTAGARQTYVYGMNGDAQVVGTVVDADGAARGFIYNYNTGTTAVVWDYPQNVGGTNFLGINDNGLVLGWANFSDHSVEFLYDENNGGYVDLPYSIGDYNFWGLNDNAQVAGGYFSGDCAHGVYLDTGLVP